MPQISVIIPVYNSGKYLSKCIESVLCQSFEDFELILVNDGSTDNSGQICDEYSAKDARIRVIHQTNQGQSVARNNAIEQMKGRWVLFCDSDDWIHPESLERLLNAALEYGVNISVGGYSETTGADPVISEELLQVQLWTPKDFYMQHFINATIPVMKLIHRTCLGDFRFPVGKYIDDEYVVYKILFTQEKLAVIPAPLYAYFVNMTSLTKRAWNPGHLDAWEAYEQQIDFFERMGDRELVHFRYCGYLENGLVNITNAENANEDGRYNKVIRFMYKRMRRVIRRAWHAGALEFWVYYEMLYQFYPLLTRIYRLGLEIKAKLKSGKK